MTFNKILYSSINKNLAILFDREDDDFACPVCLTGQRYGMQYDVLTRSIMLCQYIACFHSVALKRGSQNSLNTSYIPMGTYKQKRLLS